VLEGVEHALAKHDATPASVGTFERNTLEISAGLNVVRAAKPDAVILVGSYAPVAAILKEAHRRVASALSHRLIRGHGGIDQRCWKRRRGRHYYSGRAAV
jgi:hypothetical protein